jgi:hypothetical protein
MTTIRAMVVLNMTSSLPRDACVNTWYCLGAATEAVCASFGGALGSFYDQISGVLARDIAPATSRIKFYDMEAPKPRVPIHDMALGMGGAPVNTPLPHEMACCLSFQGTRMSGVSQARRRGRVYLGPLGTNVLTSDGKLSSTETDVIRDAAETLLTASTEAPSWSWVVYSERSDPDATTFVTNGWVDDAFDVQRRRGVDPTARQTFGA